MPIANKPTGIAHVESLIRMYSNGLSLMLIFNIFIINPIKIDKINGFKIKLFKNSNSLIFFLLLVQEKNLLLIL